MGCDCMPPPSNPVVIMMKLRPSKRRDFSWPSKIGLIVSLRVKLRYDIPSEHQLVLETGASSAMNIDMVDTIELGLEVFKRKQTDTQLSKGGSCITKRIKETVTPSASDITAEVARQPHPHDAPLSQLSRPRRGSGSV